MASFQGLLSPGGAAVATPDQQRGAAAHAAWLELRAAEERKR